MIVNKEDIKSFIQELSFRDDTLAKLMLSALETPIRNYPDTMIEVTDTYKFKTKSARRAFDKAAKRERKVYHFAPTKELKAFVEQFRDWLVNFIDDLDTVTLEAINPQLHGKLQNIQTIARAEQFMLLPEPMTKEEIDLSLKTKSKNRSRINSELIAKYGDKKRPFKLLRILTPQGMVRAGDKANNCLGYNNLPMIGSRPQEPHKTRVLRPQHWLYFQVAYPDDTVFATIIADVKNGTLWVSGNGTENGELPLSEGQDNVIFEFIDEIERQFPHLSKNYRNLSERYYTWKKFRRWESNEQNYNSRRGDGQRTAPYRRPVSPT